MTRPEQLILSVPLEVIEHSAGVVISSPQDEEGDSLFCIEVCGTASRQDRLAFARALATLPQQLIFKLAWPSIMHRLALRMDNHKLDKMSRYGKALRDWRDRTLCSQEHAARVLGVSEEELAAVEVYESPPFDDATTHRAMLATGDEALAMYRKHALEIARGEIKW